MPSRVATAPSAIASVLPQVSRLWLFLDRFESVPAYARHERIHVVRSQEAGDLRANGKLLGLTLEPEDCTYFSVDDDIEYPNDYCATMERDVDRLDGRAIVGVHAAILRQPLVSYSSGMKVLHRRSRQESAVGVDILGSDSVAFRTTTLRFDVREWPDVNMVDLCFAVEARRRGIPLISIPRAAHWVSALDEDQDDSIWASVLREDSRQTELARELASLPRPPLPRLGWRRLRYRSV